MNGADGTSGRNGWDGEGGMARPRFKPSPEDRKWVEAMSGFGVPEEAIAQAVGAGGIDPKTLRKHFRRELDTGATKANINVVQSLYRNAISGKCPAASMFWLKCRAGWRENGIPRHSGPQGETGEITDGIDTNLDDVLTAEFDRIAAAHSAAGVSGRADEATKTGTAVQVAGVEGATEPADAAG